MWACMSQCVCTCPHMQQHSCAWKYDNAKVQNETHRVYVERHNIQRKYKEFDNKANKFVGPVIAEGINTSKKYFYTHIRSKQETRKGGDIRAKLKET